MAKDFKLIGPGGKKPTEDEKPRCPFHLDARCGYLDRTIESLMGDGEDTGDELEEAEHDEG